jgi:hypothetical protein
MRLLAITGLFVLVAIVPSIAETPQLCSKVPVQLTNHVDVPATGGSATAHAAVSIQLPAEPFEVEEITVRFHVNGPNGQWLNGVQVTVQLDSQLVTHGVEIPMNAGSSTIFASLDRDAALSRQLKFYADASSQLAFSIDLAVLSVTDSSRLDVTAVGLAVMPGCLADSRGNGQHP